MKFSDGAVTVIAETHTNCLVNWSIPLDTSWFNPEESEAGSVAHTYDARLNLHLEGHDTVDLRMESRFRRADSTDAFSVDLNLTISTTVLEGLFTALRALETEYRKATTDASAVTSRSVSPSAPGQDPPSKRLVPDKSRSTVPGRRVVSRLIPVG